MNNIKNFPIKTFIQLCGNCESELFNVVEQDSKIFAVCIECDYAIDHLSNGCELFGKTLNETNT